MGRIVLVGALGIICLLSWVRLFELQAESRRLDRLIAAEKTYKGELAREREELCAVSHLKETAPELGLAEANSEPRPIWVGCLSAPREALADAGSTEGGRVATSANSMQSDASPLSSSSGFSAQPAMKDYATLQ